MDRHGNRYDSAAFAGPFGDVGRIIPFSAVAIILDPAILMGLGR
jgi:hypothetical protein